MFGIIVGTICLVAFVRLWKRRHSGRHGTGARRWMLRRLFRHLDASPGQEKVIALTAENVQRALWQARDHVFRSRSSVAQAMRAQSFNAQTVNDTFDAQQASIDEVKKVLRESLSQVHEALTEEQRSRLADLIEFGPSSMRRSWNQGCSSQSYSAEPRSPQASV